VQFDGDSLLRIIFKQPLGPVEVRDATSSFGHPVPRRFALELVASGKYVGIGNRNRIRYLRPLVTLGVLNAGSRSTRPVRADQTCRIYNPTQVIGHPRLNREYPI